MVKVKHFPYAHLSSPLFLILSLFPCGLLEAKGAGVSGGLMLLEPGSARAAALGMAYSAISNDITAFAYNPASLNSLQTGQASLLYRQDSLEQSFGQMMVGHAFSKGGLGISVSHFDGGNIELYDGISKRTVKAREDIAISLGLAGSFKKLSVGVTGKYLSSELGEVAHAEAYAGDIGFQFPLVSRLTVGAALQNFGTKLTFIEKGDPLPRLARMGASWLVFSGYYSGTLNLEVPYFLNEEELYPTLGIEVNSGVLSFRAGYKKGVGSKGFTDEVTLGTGFLMGTTTLDYAFGFVKDLAPDHRVSLSFRFGHAPQNWSFVQQRQPAPREIEAKFAKGLLRARERYEAK